MKITKNKQESKGEKSLTSGAKKKGINELKGLPGARHQVHDFWY